MANPAAFGRLRVETPIEEPESIPKLPAAFGRLRVETNCSALTRLARISQPPSGGCELKLGYRAAHREPLHPAAFGRLRVETHQMRRRLRRLRASRLRAAAS